MDLELETVKHLFRAETEEDLAVVEQLLLILEKTPNDPEAIATVFRKFHSLKGNAGSLGFDRLAELAHHVEDLLEAVRSGKEPVTPPVVTFLLQVVDAVREALPSTLAGHPGLPPSCQALLQRIQGGRLRDLPGQASLPSNAPDDVESAGTLRIDIAKLDFLLSVTSEIAVARSRLGLLIREQGTSDIAASYRTLHRLLTTMHHSVTKVRMVPIAPLLRHYGRLVRDLAIGHGKQAGLVVSDHGVEVDNSLIERLKAPLTHMIRNSVDHGIEPPDVRRHLGKDPRGRIELRARHEASGIVIEVEDDGAGLDRARILERARALGLASESATPGAREIDRLIFAQGLSTARGVSSTSGRGVGMDVVQRDIDALGGSVEVATRPGAGTTVTVRMPLTLAIIEGLVARVGEETLVVPMAGVLRCLDVPTSVAKDTPDGILGFGGEAVPFARLRSLLGLGGSPPAGEVALVVENGTARIGLVVDRIVGRAQVVVRPPGRFFKGLPAISGLTILGDGEVAPILDVAGILHQRLHPAEPTPGWDAAHPEVPS